MIVIVMMITVRVKKIDSTRNNSWSELLTIAIVDSYDRRLNHVVVQHFWIWNVYFWWATL